MSAVLDQFFEDRNRAQEADLQRRESAWNEYAAYCLARSAAWNRYVKLSDAFGVFAIETNAAWWVYVRAFEAAEEFRKEKGL